MIDWTKVWQRDAVFDWKKVWRRRRPANKWLPVESAAGGVFVGAALAYLLDPACGARRRAVIRQKIGHVARRAAATADAYTRDISHRSYGVFAGTKNRLVALGDRWRGRTVDDEILAQRVRSKLGRLCSHPHAIRVSCRDGLVELAGPILKEEVRRVLRGVSRVTGVLAIDDDLEAHAAPGDIPGLRGGMTRPAPGLFGRHWSPAARSAAGATGAALLVWGAAQRSLGGAGVGLAGLGLIARSLTSLPTRRIVGIGAGRPAVDFEKDLHVDVPVEKVYVLERFETHEPHDPTYAG